MVRIVRDSVSACQAECARTEFKLNSLSQGSAILSHNLSGQDVFVIVLLVLALVAVVVLTAVWSGNGERRKATLAVLKLLLRWHP